MRAKLHHGTVVGPPVESSHYGYSEMPPSSYAVQPAAARYVYHPGSAAAPVHHSDYQPYCVAPDRPRCNCGDRTCAQFPVYDVHGGRPSQSSTAQYYGHHVALPPGPPAVYPGHQMVYPGEHFPVMGPPPATHYHHHRHHYPLPSTAGAHFVPTLYGDSLGAAQRQMMAAAAGCGENVSNSVTTRSTPIIAGESSAAQVKNVDTAVPASDVTQYNADDGREPPTSPSHGISTTSVTAEHDFTPTRDASASVSGELFSRSRFINHHQ